MQQALHEDTTVTRISTLAPWLLKTSEFQRTIKIPSPDALRHLPAMGPADRWAKPRTKSE